MRVQQDNFSSARSAYSGVSDAFYRIADKQSEEELGGGGLQITSPWDLRSDRSLVNSSMIKNTETTFNEKYEISENQILGEV